MKPHWFAAIPFLLFLAGRDLPLRAADADLQASRDIFERRCSGCHAPDMDKVGPRLRGVWKRKAGMVAGFPYSDGLRDSGILWDEKRLDQWLENPASLVKDTDMEFRVANASERASIIAYLRSLSK